MYQLAPNMHAAAVGLDLVVLDATGDRYLALQDAISPTGSPATELAHPRLALVPEAATALIGAGILVEGSDWSPPPEIRSPGSALPFDLAEKLRGRDLVHITAALLQTFWRLKRKRPFNRYQAHRSRPSAPASAELLTAIARLRMMKLLVPTPRRCLPDALVGALFLKRLGIDVEVVFGVRSHPFDAHCWLEHDGAVLDDGLERVQGYVPIAVATL